MTKRPLPLVLALLLAAAGPVVARAGDDVGARIDEFVRAEMQRQHVPGVAIGVVKNGAVLVAKGYGLANVEHEVPVGPETVFESGSLGKQFTATAVMLQVEDGKLSLSDPITKFFPDAPAAWRAITVRNLLTHTSGIPDYTVGSFDYRKDYTEEQLAKFAFGLDLEFPPGSRWNYSNTGYVLLGIIVHKVSGRFYGDVLADRVFKPLGMTTARVISEADIVPHRAAGYRLVDGELKNQEWVAPLLNTTADGSLYLSVRDMIAWDAGVRARRVLSPESWSQVLEPVRLASGKTYPYGFGWFLEERGGKPLQQHGGAWQGFKSQFSRFIGDDLSVIVFANLEQANQERFADGVAAILDPGLAARVPSPIEDREPAVTARATRMLEAARQGTLAQSDFAYVRAGFFPDVTDIYAKTLKELGTPRRIALVERTEVGDDRVYLYEVEYASATLLLRFGLAPDDRVALFELERK